MVRAVQRAVYCHVEVMGSIPGRDEIYTEKFRLGDAPSPLSCDEQTGSLLGGS